VILLFLVCITGMIPGIKGKGVETTGEAEQLAAEVRKQWDLAGH
jgi:hypothetical protein